MSQPPSPRVSSRKQPKQERSRLLVTAILEAATQVLEQEGAPRFTTARVAERAGISVGSLYQYFPNKAAILFRLQADEWQSTSDRMCRILEDTTKPPSQRLRTLVRTFIRSECEEAQVRVALNDAAPLYRDAPEAKEPRARANRVFQDFMQEALPEASRTVRQLAGDLIVDTLSAGGSKFSKSPRSSRQVKVYADAMADMFDAYLASLQHR
ncbi:MAG TPA: TetR family transcriptional regulator [Oleiagrimonas sp.]|nr:TetR family transcriptional regulator [Oleiagrimonas sp.]